MAIIGGTGVPVLAGDGEEGSVAADTERAEAGRLAGDPLARLVDGHFDWALVERKAFHIIVGPTLDPEVELKAREGVLGD